MPPIPFTHKAETLAQLEGRLQNAQVPPQVRFTSLRWQQASEAVLERIFQEAWSRSPLIVRSSARAEDAEHQSQAGHFCSALHIEGESQLRDAIRQVLASFGDSPHQEDHIFVQPMLQNVAISGVAFTRDLTHGGHYYVLNYDDHSGSTDSVTAGRTNELKVFHLDKTRPDFQAPEPLKPVIMLLQELEKLFENDALDVEFATTQDGKLHLLQVRPMASDLSRTLSREQHLETLLQIENRVTLQNRNHPHLCGDRTILGVMPDWNPAEIIGFRPRPLALSLYKRLITDNIWAYQRNNYGYRNVRSFPLLVNLGGIPFIDVRISFNSFVPADIDDPLAHRLVNYYLDELRNAPHKHDKVEFDVLFSCYSLDLPERLETLKQHGFSEDEIGTLKSSLRHLTNRIIDEKDGLWKRDREKIDTLEQRRQEIQQSDLDPLAKIFWLMENCQRYGTLPFAGLARAGFIAVQLLRSLVSVGIMSEHEMHLFMRSLNTISSRMKRDLERLSESAFLKRYGHLRPGTYDILSPRYDEASERYFNWSQIIARQRSADIQENNGQNVHEETFRLSLEQLQLIEKSLQKHALNHDIIGLFEFIKEAIEGREFSKFIFTRTVSDVLRLLESFGTLYGFSREDLSYADIETIYALYSSSRDPKQILQAAIERGRTEHAVTKQITLPPLIFNERDIYAFELASQEPNFITSGIAYGPVIQGEPSGSELNGKIYMIPNADPGFDWIFSHNIRGFITMYGGVNSHMAIRAGELNLPAVIGAGETLFNQWAKAKALQIDCANRQVQIVQ
ncbi:MAG: phosphoenolpyruvate synthase [Magnetococcales bacterium]|nr:phosphoenolpyruvate synthase [Magnetococcales bacterium]